jgi:hypothetical protein
MMMNRHGGFLLNNYDKKQLHIIYRFVRALLEYGFGRENDPRITRQELSNVCLRKRRKNLLFN